MKILILSDSHGRHDLVRRAIGMEAPIDMLIHAGDVEGDLDQILGPGRDYELRVVAGNMDWSGGMADELVFPVGSHVVYLTHGHRLGVYSGTEHLRARAGEKGADIAVYGHIHIPVYEPGDGEDGIMVINPGSIAKPRQQGWKKTYAVMTVREDGSCDVKFRALPGNLLY